MPDTVVRYAHHGHVVAVKKKYKGLHRDICLCHQCRWFTPEDRSTNCAIANCLFAICQSVHITTPVSECKKYEGRDDEAES